MRKWILSIVLLLVQLGWASAPELSLDYREYRFKLGSIRFLPFTEERFIWYLSQQDLPYRDIVLRQARLETGGYTSLLFFENNNLFGMRNPVVRSTTSLGSRYRHAYYEHWTYSVDDYVLWYHYNMHRLDNCYYRFLKRVGYAEDPRYIPKLKEMERRENKNLLSLGG